MNKPITWRRKLNSGFIHEKAVLYSLLFLVVVLSVDCFFQNFPISGYGLVFITLLVVGFTTCATCHKIKWAITSNKPLYFYMCDKSQNENWWDVWLKYENQLFMRLLSSGISCETLKYPTHLNEQTRLLLKDIERDFVKSWYAEISSNPSFLFDSHLLLEEFFCKLMKKLKTVNYRNLLSSVLVLYLNSLQEYKKSIKKLSRINVEDNVGPKAELSDVCRYFHPGSQSIQILNYYLLKITKVILKEFSSYEFSNSLECKILSGVIARKVVRKLLMTLEDPNWLNIKLIYLLNNQKHENLLQGRIYVVKENVLGTEERDFEFKPSYLSKRYHGSSLFESSKNLFDRNSFSGQSGINMTERGTVTIDKDSLSLPLPSEKTQESKGNISSVLSGLISSTAGPLLPDNISVHYKAFNKMWQSPVAEVKDISESITNSFKKVFVNGIKEKKGVVRSKSSEMLHTPSESGLKVRDISVGEELCESVVFGAGTTLEGSRCQSGAKAVKKLTKTHSFDNDSLLIEDETDGGEVPCLERNHSSPEQQGDVSPVYEEPEDFATTIAKLRSLLQQRESTSTLSDKSNPSIDSQTADKSQPSNKSQSLDGDSFDSQFACDIPTDGRLFINIFIQKGELVTESGLPHVVYSIQYDGIYMLRNEQNSGTEPELVLQTTVVKRRFQDFLKLEMKLEENGNLNTIMKGIKGPSKWLTAKSSLKSDEPQSSSRKLMLETFLRQICSKVEICNSPELHEFLAYGQTGNDALVKKDSEPSLQRIDKLLANKLTGVFKSIKTVLPSFDFDSPTLIATNDGVKGSQEQKLLQGFLNFGNKPELFELHLNFVAKEQTGESLVDDIRHYFSQKSDGVEDAVDVLDSSDWMAEQKECRFFSPEETCVWENHKDTVLDDELEPLDAYLPIYSLIIDIISELLQESDCWLIKEPVVRLIKVISGHWEKRLEEELPKLDWDRILGNLIKLLRVAIFQPVEGEKAEITAMETKTVLKETILELMPGWITQFVKPEGLAAAVSLFVDSFQHFRLNRDFILRLMDILLVHILSCRHLLVNCA